MIIRKYNKETDAQFLYHEMSRLGLLVNHIICSDAEFIDFFEHQLRYYYSDFVIIEDGQSKQIYGFLYTWAYRVKDGHCHCDFYFSSHDQKQNEAILHMILQQLFREYPINRIFMYINTDDIKKKSLCESLGSQHEALLKEYRYRNGHYTDVCVLSIKREYFYR